MKTWKVGFIDAALFMLFWTAIAIAGTSNLNTALQFSAWYLLPVSIAVGILGTLQARAIRSGQMKLRIAAKNGLWWGSALGFAWMVLSITNDAFAAGGHLEGYPLLSRETATFVFLYGIPAMLAGGVLGSLHASAFYAINSWLLKE
ncbi:hypothetical protein [Pseudomonas sp. BN515]|uniref:hypothetical protein n=1 Tax=Pseudomonas sp. BN515 TaxID=2567892 RepID=UPI0024568826|nr:hypothetical protein [Pseudomonas sp. BN515]MDH4871370.1 hypothetical protein [Pseudomonas sp. BN515]